MLIHLIETQRHQAWHLGSTFWSAGAHVAFAGAIVAGAWTRPASKPSAPEREVVYLLPMLPSSPRPSNEPQPELRGAPAGLGEARAERSAYVAGPRLLTAEPTQRALASPLQAVIDSVERAGPAVYQEADLDRVVERDPTSAAPAYPVELEQRAIEGDVSAEWIVDTLGVADTTSFRIVTATHPAFAASVRVALPLMHFRPAELYGKKVRQMVRQLFSFRISLPAPDTVPMSLVRRP